MGAGDRARGPHGRLQLRLGHRRARAAAALGRSPRSAASACTGCAAGSRRRPSPAARARPTRTRRRSTRSPPRRWARACPPTHASRVEREILGVSRRHARPELPAAPPARCSSSARARRSRSRTRSRATGRAGSRRPDFVGSTEFDRHFVLDLVSRRGRARPGDPRDPAAAGPSTARSRPRARSLRFTRYRHGGGRDGNVTAEHAERAQEHDRRHRHGDQPGRRRRRRRRRDHHPRPPARVDGDPLALPRGHRRGLRVPGRRGEPARRPRRLHPAARRRRGAAAPRPAHLPGRPAPALRRADARGGAADRGRRVPRRAPADRHDGRAQAVPLPRPVRRGEPAGASAGGHRSASSRTSRTRSTRT